jgi:adenylate cyclase
MNIIFGDSINTIPDSYTVLELDTFKTVDGNTSIAYCIVEKIPLADFDKLEAYKKVHADLLVNYRRREWTYCEHAIEGLMGKWNGELDTFYCDLLKRVLDYKQTPPPENWDGALVKP